MDKFKDWFSGWLVSLKNTYRLVIMNDDTFEEVGSYRLTRLNVYILGSSVFVLMIILVTMIIAFTPLKEYVPGYGDVNLKSQAQKLERQVNDIETEVNARDKYIRAIQIVLTGDVDTTTFQAPKDTEGDYSYTDSDLEPTEEELAVRAETERANMQQLNNGNAAVLSYNENTLDKLYFASPIKGAVVRDEFDPDKDHYGIDLLGAKGTPILSTLEGIVMMSDYTFETGFVIAIQHTNNLVSFYKHNSKLLKKAGDKVAVGEAIAIIGNTGELTNGPHLHFELWHNGKAVNPRDFIGF
jgi:murein DD-endopeptidase MepM/ murein hydrolase activator NlpD